MDVERLVEIALEAEHPSVKREEWEADHLLIDIMRFTKLWGDEATRRDEIEAYRRIARAVALAVIEECAKECQRVAGLQQSQGQSVACYECGDKLRALADSLQPPKGEPRE